MNFFTRTWREMVVDFKALMAQPKVFWQQSSLGLKSYFVTDTLANIGLILVLTGLVMNHLEKFPTSFYFVAVGMLLVGIGLIGGLVEAIRGGKSYAYLSIIVWGLVLTMPVMFIVSASGAPAIHDITTDLKSPPQFKAVLALRPAHANSLDRSQRGLKTKQRKAYPKVRTLRMNAKVHHPGKVFEAARALAEEKGWEVVAVSPKRRVIEAVDKSLFMGFRDDVIIRIGYRKSKRPAVLIDMRSVSRFGRSDVGKNAARIESFLAQLKQELKEEAAQKRKAKRKKRKKKKN